MSYELTIEPLGQTIEVEDGQSILDAALRAGIYLPHACCHGLCATCKVQVIDGEVDHGEASKRHQWPGNVRELENMIERGVILAPQDGWIELEHLFTHVGEAQNWEFLISAAGNLENKPEPCRTVALLEAILGSGISFEDLETRLLEEAVRRSDGNLAGAARLLGITRPQLQYRLKKQDNLKGSGELK